MEQPTKESSVSELKQESQAPNHPPSPPHTPPSPSIARVSPLRESPLFSASVCQPINSTATVHEQAKSPIPLPLTADLPSPAKTSFPSPPVIQPVISPFPALRGFSTATASVLRREEVTVLVPPPGSPQPQNLSFILKKPHEVEFAERPVPQLKSDHDVLVAVQYTGICGSDVHYWEHGRIGHFVVEKPMVLGHESAGTIVAVGSAVKTLAPGDRVALEPGYPCRRCNDCLAGRYNLCYEMQFAATPPYDGTLTGFWAAPFDFCYKLPDNVSLQEGALIEPLAVAVHVVRQARVTPGQSVVIMGAGPVGLLCAAVAKSFGATKVVSVDIIGAKLDFAKQYASTHTYLSQRVSAEQNAKALKEAAHLEGGADVVIDASGAEPSIQTSLHAIKVGGTYVQAGMGKPDINFPIMAMCLKEVTARGSFRYSAGDYRLAVELLGAGRVDVKPLINGVVEFQHAEEAFKKVKEGQVIKILIAGPNEKLKSEEEESPEIKEEEKKEIEEAAKINGEAGENGCC